MRLWSIHPRYLDAKGLVALWREALLAQAVLTGLTRGYRNHPQLARFTESAAPQKYIAAYLRAVHVEADRRGYCFDARKIGPCGDVEPLVVTRRQLDYEWAHLVNKLRVRAPAWLEAIQGAASLEPHPLFRVVDGPVAEWEVVSDKTVSPGAQPLG